MLYLFLLLLHGFPEFWGAWQHQITALANAGFRAVAMDLRGYGASDKPPRGYDGYTAASDVTGLIRALGEREATIVGSGYGGMVAVLSVLSVFRPISWVLSAYLEAEAELSEEEDARWANS